MKIGEALYTAQAAAEQGAAGPEAGPGAGPGGKPDEKVVDAEFEEVDPNKKKPS
jgi:molecular chaperone DnaK